MTVWMALDRLVFEQLVERHHRMLLAYAAGIGADADAAEEAVQDACVTAWQVRERFDDTRDFPAWMRGIIRNKLHEQARRRRRLRPLEDTDADADAVDGAFAAYDRVVADGADPLAALSVCVEALPEQMRTAVRLTYFDGLDGAAVADAAGVAAPAMRKRLQRAREALALCIAQRIGMAPGEPGP